MNEANSSFYSVLTAPYGDKYNISIVDPKFNLVIDSNVREAIKDNLENRVRFTYTLQNNSSNFRFLGT